MPAVNETVTSKVLTAPVKVVIERVVNPGRASQFERWARHFAAAAGRFPGHQDTSVLSVADGAHQFILLRFASQSALDRWEWSTESVELMHEVDTISNPGEPAQTKSGMETWFTLPDVPAPASAPPKWKMAIVTWSVLLPMALALSLLLGPFQLPFLLDVAINTGASMAILTWFAMPTLTRVLYAWLYGHPAQ